jgi:hypothetical protein
MGGLDDNGFGRIFMAEEKELVRKLEAVNRQKRENDDQVVRKAVVTQRKKELARTVSDLDDMLQGLYAKNDFRLKRCKSEAEEEERLQGVLAKLQEQVKELLALNPEECSDDQMAALAAKIESTRRAILRIHLGHHREDVRTGSDSASKGSEFLLLSNWQKFQLGLVVSLPLIFTVGAGFILIALVIWSVFGA